jgi:hypothetical protein
LFEEGDEGGEVALEGTEGAGEGAFEGVEALELLVVDVIAEVGFAEEHTFDDGGVGRRGGFAEGFAGAFGVAVFESEDGAADAVAAEVSEGEFFDAAVEFGVGEAAPGEGVVVAEEFEDFELRLGEGAEGGVEAFARGAGGIQIFAGIGRHGIDIGSGHEGGVRRARRRLAAGLRLSV